jgi:hypothetical protein
MSFVLRAEGLSIPSGETADLSDYSDLQSMVMPVVSLQEGRLECWGTAVCVGALGWFLTARHVVDDFVDAYGHIDDGTTGLFVLWETDERLPGRGPSDYLGAPLPVTYLHRHSSADLVALTVSLPAQAPERLRVATLAFRMPALDEPLAVAGYSKMSLRGEVKPGSRSTVVYERTLSISAGTVLETQHERLSTGLRGSPGIVTDAPIKSGMSGGPVLDQNGEVVGFASSSMAPGAAGESWNSYVALCGPVLELAVLAREFDDAELQTITLAELVAEEAILCSWHDTADVDPELGIVIYPRGDTHL